MCSNGQNASPNSSTSSSNDSFLLIDAHCQDLRKIKRKLEESIDMLGVAGTLAFREGELMVKEKMGEKREGIAFGGGKIADHVEGRVRALVSPLEELRTMVTEMLKDAEHALTLLCYPNADKAE